MCQYLLLTLRGERCQCAYTRTRSYNTIAKTFDTRDGKGGLLLSENYTLTTRECMSQNYERRVTVSECRQQHSTLKRRDTLIPVDPPGLKTRLNGANCEHFIFHERNRPRV